MDRARASSLESHHNLCDRYDSCYSNLNLSDIGRRKRLSSLAANSNELSEESPTMENYRKKPLVANSELKSQFDVLQCTVNRMLNGGVLGEKSSKASSVNLSEALKHEYHQMLSALKELEQMLGCRRINNDVHCSTTSCNNNSEIVQLQREIYCRDSLIKCLSDRLKVLCKANDKLIIDYENQENILSEELICLKRQLEKAKEALRTLSAMKSRTDITAIQDIEKESYYLKEALKTKELIVNDLKHKLDKISRENMDLKCELETKDVANSRFESNQFDRELSYSNHLNDQLKAENNSLKTKVEFKNQIINELNCKLNTGALSCQDHNIVNKLRDELLMTSEENEMTKETILEQLELLEDFKNQIKILSERNQFKDEKISELQCCLMRLSECPQGPVTTRDFSHHKNTDERCCQSVDTKNQNLICLMNSIKRYICQHDPHLMKMIDNDHCEVYNALEKFVMNLIDLVGQANDTELFKEYLTNEINLKNKIITFLTENLTEEFESLEKLQAQMNSILTLDMDCGFKVDLKSYLHQCYLLDDYLKSVIEHLVKAAAGAASASYVDRNEIYSPGKLRDKATADTASRMTSTTTMELEVPRKSVNNDHLNKIKELENELHILNKTFKQERMNFSSEFDEKNRQLEMLSKKIAEFQKNLDEKTHIVKNCQLDNERLRGEYDMIFLKNQQNERNLNMKNQELQNLEDSMHRASDQFVNLSLTQEQVKKSIENIKDAEIERLIKEIEGLKLIKSQSFELKQTNSELGHKISFLTKNIQALEAEEEERKKNQSGLQKNLHSLEAENEEKKKLCNSLQKELDKCNMDKENLVSKLKNMEEEKNKETDELQMKINSLQKSPGHPKPAQTDFNNEMEEVIEKLKNENNQLRKHLKDEELQSAQLKTSLNNMKIEIKTIEMKNNSLNCEMAELEHQLKQLRNKIVDLNRSCEESHIDRNLLKCENEQSELCKQKVLDLEGILSCLTEELNEKVNLVEDLRKMVNNDSYLDTGFPSCPPKCDLEDLNKQLLLQKDSEISFLKSKIYSLEKEMSVLQSQTKNIPVHRLSSSEMQNLKSTISELERRTSQLNQQLTERSENITHLQKLLNEKDDIIENTYKTIKAKDEIINETKNMMHLISLENANIKSEMNGKSQGESQLELLKSTIRNQTEEIGKLRSEIENSRLEIHKLISEKQNKHEPSILPKAKLQQQVSYIPESSVQQINNEIHKLYVDFEDKNNEIKEYSLKEIKNRDRKIEELNLELKLKSDQFTTILVENRRLHDKVDNDSQKSMKYEQNLLLKEQLLEKLLKEKEKIRATFITELNDKNEELNDKTKTVYFLNSELHRLASEVEILNAELHVVKVGEHFNVQPKNTLEISYANVQGLQAENSSLKLCINVQTSEMEAMKSELTVKQVRNDQLFNDVHSLSLQSNEYKENYENLKANFAKIENDYKNSIDGLNKQLMKIQEKYEDILHAKSTMESVIKDLENENRSLKQSKELLENEKIDWKIKVDNLKSQIDIDQLEIKRLTSLVETHNMSMLNQGKTKNQTLEQISELTEGNLKYKLEIEKVSKQFHELDEEYRLLSAKLEKLEVNERENELFKYLEVEGQLSGELKHKSDECERLKKDYEAALQQCDQFQRRFEELENQEQNTYRLIDQKDFKCNYLQDNLEHIKSQLYVAEDKLKMCNNQWLDKYGLLKSNYDNMECECMQLQTQLESINHERDLLETKLDGQCGKINNFADSCHKLEEENSHLRHENCMKSTELDRLQCEKETMENCNMELRSQIESISRNLMSAHTEICELTVKLHESQTKINDFSFKLKENLCSSRHYGSHPLLNRSDVCGSDINNFEQKDYSDLKTRYSSSCNQIDNLICQLKKKDKRLMDIQKDYDQLMYKLGNYDQIRRDYQDLDEKYQQLKDDFDGLTQYYRNINYSHNEDSFPMIGHEVSVIQVCTNELQDRINCQNQEIDNLKLSYKALENDYGICCERIKQLEEQIQLDNLEMEKMDENYYSCESNCKQFENKYSQLKYAYDDAMNQIDQINDLKQENTDKTTRIIEIVKINENVEQQLIKARQQMTFQNQIIDESKMKLRDMELFYEEKIEQYRYDISLLKGNNRSPESNEKSALINCLTEKNQLLECELKELQNQYRMQCSNMNELRQELDCQTNKPGDMRKEYEEQCKNLKKLSVQLLDKNNLVRQLTDENNHLNSEHEIVRQKMNHLIEQNDCLSKCLMEKSNDLVMFQRNFEAAEENGIAKERESMDLSNHADFLAQQLDQRNCILEEYKKELANAYQTIDEIKLEKIQICEDLNKLYQLNAEKDECIFNKNAMLAQYGKELGSSYERIQKFLAEQTSNTRISVQEFCEMKALNEQLASKLFHLENHLDKKKSIKKQVSSKQNQQTDVDNLLVEINPKDWNTKPLEIDKSVSSDLTYSSSKSVTWKSTHTDQPIIVGTGVMELQKAIDEYNTLVTSIELSESGLVTLKDSKTLKNFEELLDLSRNEEKPSSLICANDQKINMDLQNQDEVDVIVDLDSTCISNRICDQDFPIDIKEISDGVLVQQTCQVDSLIGINHPEIKNIIDLLRNSNIKMDYDESKEPFQSYFYRTMQKYHELEQFYLISMKINLDDSQDISNLNTVEMFTEFYEKSQQNLSQHCQVLKSSIVYDSIEPDDGIKPMNEQKLSIENTKQLVDLIISQKLQLAALNLTHEHLQEIDPIYDTDSHKIIPVLLTEEYQKILMIEDVCNPDIRLESVKVKQTSLNDSIVESATMKDMTSSMSVIRSPFESLQINKKKSTGSSKASVQNPILDLSTGKELAIVNTEESVQLIGITSDLAKENIEQINPNLSSQKVSRGKYSSIIKNVTKSVSIGKTSDVYVPSESLKSESNETPISANFVMESQKDSGLGSKLQQHLHEEGTAVSESKTQSIKNMEESHGFASLELLAKEMHQLNNMDYDNFDNSIPMEDRVKIYGLEIDYLNEKNLFHTYAINFATDSPQDPHNLEFIDKISSSLTNKAKSIKALQTEHKFDLHMSKNETDLINKVLDPTNDFSYRTVFDNLSNDITKLIQKETSSSLMEKIKDLTKKLEYCQSKIESSEMLSKGKSIESLILEKATLEKKLRESNKEIKMLKTNGKHSSQVDTLNSQLQEYKSTVDRLSKQNESLKDIVKSNEEKGQLGVSDYNNDKLKQSKIPLLKVSLIEGTSKLKNEVERKSMKWEEVNKRLLADMTNISKNINSTSDVIGLFKHTNNNTDDLIKASKDISSATDKMIIKLDEVKKSTQDNDTSKKSVDIKDKSSLQPAGKLVSPEEVKAAILGETSIDSLRQFASLLADDNFDLAAEIEKLLLTIEELREQLKENCEILAETVDMLQNSEEFVNQLERKLNVETKKAQVITGRIDKLNELNCKVIGELERMLKQPPSNITGNIDVQERYDYLFACLKKIEAENVNLQNKKNELESCH